MTGAPLPCGRLRVAQRMPLPPCSRSRWQLRDTGCGGKSDCGVWAMWGDREQSRPRVQWGAVAGIMAPAAAGTESVRGDIDTCTLMVR